MNPIETPTTQSQWDAMSPEAKRALLRIRIAVMDLEMDDPCWARR